MSAITLFEDPFAGLDSRFPITLFPVRLETRFVRYDPPPGSPTEPVGELRIRIYPDGILNDTHDPLLTGEEQAAGKAYWRARWKGSDREKMDAWNTLSAEVGAQRAAWIVRQMTPSNLTSSDSRPRFSKLTTRDPKTRPAPRTHLLPDQWLVQAICAPPREQVYHELSQPVQADLSLTVALGKSGNQIGLCDDLEVDEAIKWTFDFDEALDVGMAIRIRLKEEDFRSGFSRVIVTGVKGTSLSVQESAQALDDLFEGHHYTRGFSFIRQGTPTNNTAQSRSGFPPPDPQGDESRKTELDAQWDGNDDGCDGDHFSQILGISPQALKHVAGAGGEEQKNARAMATALWPATVGYTMETMMSSQFDEREETLYEFEPDTVRAARGLFIDHVRGRGPVSAFRIGDVPYGVLPVARLPWEEEEIGALMEEEEDLLGQLPCDVRVARVLAPRLAALVFRLLQLCDVPSIGRHGAPDVDLIGALSMRAAPHEFYIRPMFGRDLTEELSQVVGGLGDDGIPANAGYMGTSGTAGEWLGGRDAERLVDLRGDPTRGGQIPNIRDGGAGGMPLDDFYRIPDNVIHARQTLQGDGGTMPPGARSAPGVSPEDMARAVLSDWGSRPIMGYFGDAYRFNCGVVVNPPDGTEEEALLSETEGLGDKNCILPLYAHTLAQRAYHQSLKAYNHLQYIGSPPSGWPPATPPQMPEDNDYTRNLQSYTQTLHAYNQSLSTGSASPQSPPELPSVESYPRTLLYLLLRQATQLAENQVTKAIDAFSENPEDNDLENELEQQELELQQYEEALQLLMALPTAELERLLTETLGVCSYRIDAWITALADQRLSQIRQILKELREHDDAETFNERSSHIAAYGWVENLKPIRNEERRTVTDMEGVTAQTYSSGYIYAPSPAHGSTAAVLRSAFEARKGEGEHKPYEIDLSSARVRTALWLLDAVREGQPLGAVLGYLFERALHDAGLDSHIDEIRAQYPLVANKLGDNSGPVAQVAARNVVDGYALLSSWRERNPRLQYRCQEVTECLRQIDDAMDAVADLLTAESVYQWIKGGPGGSGSTLDAIAKGARPPEPEVASVPMGGTSLIHRVGLVLNDPVDKEGWGYKPRTPRGMAEPWLNAWAGRILGDPKQTLCRVYFSDDERQTVTLKDLEIDPLDLLALTRALEDESLESELNRRVSRAALNLRASGSKPTAIRRIQYDLPVHLSHQRSFAEILELARALNRVRASSRPIWPADLVLPERQDYPRVKKVEKEAVADLEDRAKRLLTELGNFIVALSGACKSPSKGDGLLALLQTAALFGAASAFPEPGMTEDAKGLQQMALTIAGELDQRLHAAKEHGGDPHKQIKAIFGRDFTVMPRFVPENLPNLKNALANAPALGNDPEATLSAWMAQSARVRKPLDSWRRLMLYATAMGPRPPQPQVVQLPHSKGDTWAALKFDSDSKRPMAGKLSLVLHSPDTLMAGTHWAGLMLDEWVELIPNADEDAGVVFHYDSPGAEAPHAVLIASPPHGMEEWNGGTLLEILSQTFDLVRSRGADGEYYTHMGMEDDSVEQELYSGNAGNALFDMPIPFLPMICIAENMQYDYVSPHFQGCLEGDDITTAQEE